MSIFDKASSSSYWRGFNYYLENRVKNIKKISDEIFEADVQGTKLYHTKINLNYPYQNACTCPFVEDNHKVCKHMIALAFHICPEELERIKRQQEEEARLEALWEKREEKRQKRATELMKAKEQEIRKYVDSLSKDELKELVYNQMIKEASESIHHEVYGYDDEDDYYDQYEDDDNDFDDNSR